MRYPEMSKQAINMLIIPDLFTYRKLVFDDDDGRRKQKLQPGFTVTFVHLKAKSLQVDRGTGRVIFIAVLKAKRFARFTHA